MFVLQILEKNEVLHSLSPASLVVPPWPVLTVCDHGQAVALPDRLSHTASSFFTRRPHSWSCAVPTDTQRVYRLAGRDLEHHASRCSIFKMMPRMKSSIKRMISLLRFEREDRPSLNATGLSSRHPPPFDTATFCVGALAVVGMRICVPHRIAGFTGISGFFLAV